MWAFLETIDYQLKGSFLYFKWSSIYGLVQFTEVPLNALSAEKHTEMIRIKHFSTCEKRSDKGFKGTIMKQACVL